MTKNKNPEHNKLRLVLAVDANNKVLSYFHIDHSEADKIFKLMKFVTRMPRNQWILVSKVAKATRLKRSTIERIIRLVSGALWADMKNGDKYDIMIPGRMIYMKNAIYNKKRNLPNIKLPYRAPTYIRRADV